MADLSLSRRIFLSLPAATAAKAVPPPRVGEKFEDDVCPWSAEDPRHDHQLIFPLSEGRLMLAWSEYYVRKPSRILRTSYSKGGSDDAAPCQISARISSDGGRHWSGKISLQENFGVDNVKQPNLLRLPSGEILFTFTARDIGKQTLKVYLRRSHDECETWSEPVQISPEGGIWFINADHNLLHSSGRIILPCHYGKFYGAGDHYVAFCLYSDDQGRTWQASSKRADLPKRGAEEPAVVELKDGSLLALLRTSLGKIYQTISTDRGETWSGPQPTSLPSPSAASCLKRIPKTGDLLFLWNNAAALTTPGADPHYPRNPLSSAISRDEGKSWESIKTIEDRRGYSSAYPAITFFKDEALVTYYHSSASMSRDSWVKMKIFDTDWFYAPSTL